MKSSEMIQHTLHQFTTDPSTRNMISSFLVMDWLKKVDIDRLLRFALWKNKRDVFIESFSTDGKYSAYINVHVEEGPGDFRTDYICLEIFSNLEHSNDRELLLVKVLQALNNNLHVFRLIES